MLRKLQPHEILYQDDDCLATIYPNTFIQGDMVDENKVKEYNARQKARSELEAAQKAFGRSFGTTGYCFVSSARNDAGGRIGYIWYMNDAGGTPEAQEITVFTTEDFAVS